VPSLNPPQTSFTRSVKLAFEAPAATATSAVTLPPIFVRPDRVTPFEGLALRMVTISKPGASSASSTAAIEALSDVPGQRVTGELFIVGLVLGTAITYAAPDTGAELSASLPLTPTALVDSRAAPTTIVPADTATEPPKKSFTPGLEAFK